MLLAIALILFVFFGISFICSVLRLGVNLAVLMVRAPWIVLVVVGVIWLLS
jgi:hypothetical protein